MDRRVAQGRSQLPSEDPSSSPFLSVAVGCALVAIALVVYNVSHPFRFYDHFEWQALAFLEGEAAIRYPVGPSGMSLGNRFFQDVLPVATTDGVARGLVPFPPLPAVVLLPFVAVWGLATDGQLVFAILGGIDVGLAWWMVGRLPVRTWVRVAATLFFGFGTVFWYAAQIGTTWYQAHVLAVGLALAAVAVALGADRRSALREDDLEEDDLEENPSDRVAGPSAGRGSRRSPSAIVRAFVPDRRQFLAGLLFGLACTSRLTVVFAAPFFLLVGGGGTWLRRGWSAGLGAGIPLVMLVVYNLVATGHAFHPGYQHLYELEASFYPGLNYNLDWLIEDPRYLPQNLGIMLLNTPVWMPTEVPSALGLGDPLCTDAREVRGLFDLACPLVLPRDTGMSILLTSPAFLLAIPALRWGYGLSRLVTGAALAVLIVAVVNLMHFSQGWVQFGYRFSNDFVPWALLLVAIGMERVVAARKRGVAAVLGVALIGVLVAASVAVNLWGTVWGDALGW
ncbi:MAG TPA: hypothetical protein VM427_10295 [Patescibacteria group bacterium]|nr:hypothetical protein [Patescibacteria group bacterium]